MTRLVKIKVLQSTALFALCLIPLTGCCWWSCGQRLQGQVGGCFAGTHFCFDHCSSKQPLVLAFSQTTNCYVKSFAPLRFYIKCAFIRHLLRESPFSLWDFPEGNLVSLDCWLLIAQHCSFPEHLSKSKHRYGECSKLPNVLIEKYTLTCWYSAGFLRWCLPVFDVSNMFWTPIIMW